MRAWLKRNHDPLDRFFFYSRPVLLLLIGLLGGAAWAQGELGFFWLSVGWGVCNILLIYFDYNTARRRVPPEVVGQISKLERKALAAKAAARRVLENPEHFIAESDRRKADTEAKGVGDG